MPRIAEEVKWGEDNSIDLVPQLTDEELHILEEKKKTLDKLLEEEGKAKYKIDLQLASGYSTLAPSAGLVSIWESGKKFHGGGDCKVYICPGKEKGISDCEAFIPETGQGYGFGYCPSCKNVWKGEEMGGEYGYRLTSQGWAQVLLRWFQRAELNADLRIKYPPDDIRSVGVKEQEKQMMGDALQPARKRRRVRIYTLGAIIKDTSVGSDLYKRIYAFITA